ncbi:hypothetical protein AVEN_72481-1 [Araneus ventricosus]|uniref:Uncharacterized protein n=1 Tax=Araneus ventricosus TaxID=182803 RepID=A0A4Y2G8E9_ARAVE|nr:hypothetical protein AVEN_72481-1 [Araneus ventricosus]
MQHYHSPLAACGFRKEDVLRETEYFDEKSGTLLRSPLQYPKLKEGAIPMLVSDKCPPSLQPTMIVSRESPPKKRKRLEDKLVRKAQEASIETANYYMKRLQFIENWDGLLPAKKLGSIPVMDSVQTVLSLYVNTTSLRELGDIESLGIREPIKNVSKRKAIVEQLKEFHEKLNVLPDGRYEVESPWKLDARTNLPDNKELALQRQESAILRARNKESMVCTHTAHPTPKDFPMYVLRGRLWYPKEVPAVPKHAQRMATGNRMSA